RQAAGLAARRSDAQGAGYRRRVFHLVRPDGAGRDSACNSAEAARRGTAGGAGSGLQDRDGKGRDSGELPRPAGVPEVLGRGREEARRGGEDDQARRAEVASMAAAQGKVIITCAVTGSIHTPTMSPHLPITPEEIAQAAIGAARAGAAIVHLHARDPKDGRPTQDPELFRQFARKIKAESDVVINFTTGGAPTMSIEERLQPTLKLKPEVASLNMGSMNFGLYEMLGRYKEFKHDWEKPYPAGSDDRIFKNTFKDIAYILESCAENDTRFEIECYDIGPLYVAAHFVARRLLKPPLFIQSVFGIRGGIGPHPEDVLHMK